MLRNQTPALAISLLLTLAFAPLLRADETALQPSPPPDYRIQPGDVLAITVLNQAQYSFSSLTVTPDGKIAYPLAGQLAVEGKTVAEVASMITEVLKRELRQPQVTVSIVRAQPQNVYVLGEVQKPGPYDLMSARLQWVSIPTAIGMAGGYTARALSTYVTLIRKGGEPQQIPLQTTGGSKDSIVDPGIKLYPGDAIVIPRISDSVSVLGKVITPGQYELLPQDNILSILSKAGGLAPEADHERALLFRSNGTQIEISLRGLNEGTIKPDQLPPLQSGDTILILEARNDVVVLGEVQKPGSIPLAPQMTVADAIARAGGPTQDADLERVEIIDRQGNKRTVALANEKGQLTADQLKGQELQVCGGETVVVPRIERYVSVLGYVKNPGRFRFEPGERIAELVARAGGPIPGEARPDQTVLIRPGAQPGQAEILTCNLSSVLQGKTDLGNVQVRHMDIVYVPGKPEVERMTNKDWIRSLLQLGSILAVWSR
ncbi:MAG: SLBB domain-containing protein [Armatimonadetes bacterium]|nr:SLBB domain-containing protein [Armatimonadota bacterium]